MRVQKNTIVLIMLRYYDLPFRYLPATLKANEGRMMKASMKRSFLQTILNTVPSASMPLAGKVNIINIPRMPNAMAAQMNMRVAVFCMAIV